jgi:2-keto-3-deoxy-L-rhamnonate aldolase RhmA
MRPNKLRELDNFCWAAELYDLSSMIKVDYELMIEKQPAVEHLEEILAVPGIDMIQ